MNDACKWKIYLKLYKNERHVKCEWTRMNQKKKHLNLNIHVNRTDREALVASSFKCT